MQVSQAVALRQSVRAFRETEVPGAVVRDILERALWAPSGGNAQPWRIYALMGTALEEFRTVVRRRSEEQPEGEMREYAIYPVDMPEPYNQYRRQCTEAMYGAIGVAREDKAQRLAHVARNFDFFGAPVALFFFLHRRMGPPQWADLGMLMQTVMLLAVERGLDTCAQEAWSRWPSLVGEFVGAPGDHILFSGMALGHRDDDAPINKWRTTRAQFADAVKILGAED